MNGNFKRLTVIVTVFSLIALPCTSCLAKDLMNDDEIVAGKMAGDALVVRPLGICASVIGSALFIISLPFSALGGNTKPAYDHLVAEPFKFTFNRPLGEF